jgi:hypothetical protein
MWMETIYRKAYNFKFYLITEYLYIADVGVWLSSLDTLIFLLPKYSLIIWLSNLMILSVPDEGYSRNVLCTL